jgi:hypothetical protein
MSASPSVIWMCREPPMKYERTAKVERLYADVSLADFLREVFHAKEPTDQIVTLKFKQDPGKDGGAAFRFPNEQFADAADVTHDPGGNNYFCVSSFPENFPARQKKYAKAFHVLVLDDPSTKSDASEILEKLGQPTYKLQTSASDQWGYVLKETPSAEIADDACRAITRLGLGDKAGNNTVRWVRSYAGINTKPGANNCKVRLTAWNPSWRLGLEEMCKALGITGEGTPKEERHDPQGSGGTFDLAAAIQGILTAESFHSNLVSLAAHYAATGVKRAQAIIHMQGLMIQAQTKTDPARWKARFDAIPNTVDSAFEKFGNENRKRKYNIAVVVGENMEVVEALRPALADLQELDVYVYGGHLVEPYLSKRNGRRDKDGKPTTTHVLALASLTYQTFKNRIQAVAQFTARKLKKGKWDEQRVEVPDGAAQELYGMPSRWESLQTIERITETPLLIGKELISTPGFHSGVWINAPTIELPELTKDNARAALKRIETWLEEFPLDEANRTAAVALLMLSAMRASLDIAPGFVISKPSYGSGASTLTDLTSIVHSGRRAPVLSMTANEEENRKIIEGELHSGASFLNLDNLPEGVPFESALLGQVCSEQSGKVRIMGKNNQQPEVPFGRMVILNGNNVTGGRDLARRTLNVRLDPKMSNPEDRKFKRTSLLDDAIRERESILTDLFTIAAAYVACGARAKVKPLATYDEFRERIAAPLVWLGRPDVVETVSTKVAPDEASLTLAALLPLWRRLKGNGTGLTVPEALECAGTLGGKDYAQFQRLLAKATKTTSFQGHYDIDPNKVSIWLRGVRDRVADGYRFEQAEKKGKHAAKWRVTRVDGPKKESE